MWLTRLAITRPIVIWMALAALAVLGTVAYVRLPAELNPRVDIPTLTVVTVYPGASPPEVESQVTKPLEDAVGAVGNVKDVFSSSQESVSIISMDFAVGTDLDSAIASVREKVESARMLLPQDARAPVVAKLDLNAQPILYLGFYGDVSLSQLRDALENRIKPRLARVDGVAAVTLLGGEQREVRVAVDASKLQQVGITIDDVVNSVKAANRDVPAGSIVQGRREVGVRTVSAVATPDDILDAQILAPQLLAASYLPALPMMPRPAVKPAPLTVADVATVSETVADPTTITRMNGRPGVGLVVTKTADANTVDVVEAVRSALDSMRGLLPRGTAPPIVSRDDSVMVRAALEDVDASLVLGALLAVAVVYLFLRSLRGTIIVALALPACLVATFMAMYFAGFTLNQMTLLALSLSVGILIDDSIVVLESIMRHMSRGEEPAEAAFNGRTEIGFAGMTLTLADVVVFLPIAFMGGIVGAFFRQFGLTVVAATLFSLVVSFTVTPSLAARWYRRGAARPAVEQVTEQPAWWERSYRRVVLWALANRWWVVATGVVVLAATVLVAMPSLGFEFLPATDQGQIAITLELPPDASLTATDLVAQEVERRIAGTPDVENSVTTVGQILGGFGSIPQQGPQYAQINLRLAEKVGLLERILALGMAPGRVRARSDEDVVRDLRARLRDVAGGRIVVSAVRTVANVGPPVQVQLRGPDLQELTSAATQLRDRMAHMPGIVDPDVSVRTGRPEVQVKVDPVRAAALDVPPAQAGAIVRTALAGNTDSTLRRPGYEEPIRVQLAHIDRNSVADLAAIPVGYKDGHTVTLGQVAQFAHEAGPSAIDRTNGQRMVTVTANLAPGYPLGNAIGDIQANMADIGPIDVNFGGESEAMAENVPHMALALGLAVILVYLVMASLFNSLLNPFIIMFTLPMALVGALAGLVLTGSTLSLVAMIGVMMLVGLMGRNAILLIDYAGTLRARGLPRDEAVAESGSTRLRPILMTTLATIFGMLPVALHIGRASELRAPMAVVVIGGLLVSTVLTLVMIPVLYTLADDLQQRWQRKRPSPGPRAPEADHEQISGGAGR